jgi:asparagine synthase (glutamine-hydrolysing)
MCGFIACFTSEPISHCIAERALEQLAPRGPDDKGEWREDGIFLGHRRLAIIDLDSSATQPMVSLCGRYVIVFNGEIYNYKEIRNSLIERGVSFKTKSDTEVILNLFSLEGENMLNKLNGMFAFAIWDNKNKEAFIARDPYGIKPLYIANTSKGVIVASQVKTILTTDLVTRNPDLIGQANFWMLGYVPEPHTWFKDIQVLKSGHFVKIKENRIVEYKKWLDIGDAWRTFSDMQKINSVDLYSRVKNSISESVSRHLVADVPIGVFLSGGIDSGVLAGMMAESVSNKILGITITYDEYNGRFEDEAPIAAKVAEYYGIEHHIRRVTKDEFLNDLPRIIESMDQPSIDGVNTWYVCKAASEIGLKVVISGVGGDELFFGYASFNQLPKLVSYWSKFSKLPGFMFVAHKLANYQMNKTGKRRWAHAPDMLQSIPGAWWLRRGLNAYDDLQNFMSKEQINELGKNFNVEEWVYSMTGNLSQDSMLGLAQIESMAYLRNQLLRDSDWASMAHSIELRTPLVDAKLLFDLAPYLALMKSYKGKILLANAPEKPLPEFVTKRSKTGFGIPLQSWLGEESSTGLSTDFRQWANKVVLKIYS